MSNNPYKPLLIDEDFKYIGWCYGVVVGGLSQNARWNLYETQDGKRKANIFPLGFKDKHSLCWQNNALIDAWIHGGELPKLEKD